MAMNLKVLIARSLMLVPLASVSASAQEPPRIVGEIEVAEVSRDRTLSVRTGEPKVGKAGKVKRSPKMVFRQISPPHARGEKRNQKLVPKVRGSNRRMTNTDKEGEVTRHFFTVSATCYEGRGSHLQVWHEGNQYDLWSNFSWFAMEGVPAFEEDGRRYTFMLFPSLGNSTGEKAEKNEMPDLPDLKADGPRFTAENGTPREVIDFVDSAHRLYLHEEKRLKTAQRVRRANRKLAAESAATQTAPNPKKLEVTFWRNSKMPVAGKESKR